MSQKTAVQPVQAIHSSHPLFHNHERAWKQLLPHVRQKTVSKDTSMIHHGDAAQALWLVERGWVKLTRQTPDGKETIIGLCTHGDVFGEAALFPHASYPYHAEAIGGDVELLTIPSDIIRGVIAQDAGFSAGIMSLLSERVSKTQLKLEHMSTLSAAQRLGCFLLRLCQLQNSGSITLQIPIEKHILAAYLGMKPETLSRSQQQLKPLGIATDGHAIHVTDIGKLRDFVCNSCSESGECNIEPTS